jgi:hypothetical protein
VVAAAAAEGVGVSLFCCSFGVRRRWRGFCWFRGFGLVLLLGPSVDGVAPVLLKGNDSRLRPGGGAAAPLRLMIANSVDQINALMQNVYCPLYPVYNFKNCLQKLFTTMEFTCARYLSTFTSVVLASPPAVLPL